MNERVKEAIGCLGKGFDVNSDFRLKYCRGHERLLVLSEEKAPAPGLAVPGFGVFDGVSVDIKCDKGDRVRHRSDVLDFAQMSVLMNRRSSIGGRYPSGRFNHAYGFSGGAWSLDAKSTRCLAFNGCVITLFDLRVDRRPLVLSDVVVAAVPSSWDPAALARFIETFGTHVITGMSMGGEDVVFVRQERSSTIPASEINEHLDKLGDQLFSETCALPMRSLGKKSRNKDKLPEAFDVFNVPVLADGSTSISSNKGITVFWSKRGGASSTRGHSEWLLTVPSAPEVVNFTFTPITSLLEGVPGKGFLTHAISLYLRYKPPIGDLQYFLDFQSHKIWAPTLHDLPLGPLSNRKIRTASLQFHMMGPKIFVNTNQVTVGRAPVTGMRLYLEGKRNNRLAVHLQHLSMVPSYLKKKIHDASLRCEAVDGADERFYAPVQNKKFSHVCTAPVKYDPKWKTDVEGDVAFIVSGAQLVVNRHDRRHRSVLHLKLAYSAVSDFFVERSTWEQASPAVSHRSGLLSTISGTFSGTAERAEMRGSTAVDAAATPNVVMDSGVFVADPPVPVQEQKLLKFVDTSQVCKGPQDSPGHWVVTGARLELNRGRICLLVKFSLLASSAAQLTQADLEVLHWEDLQDMRTP